MKVQSHDEVVNLLDKQQNEHTRKTFYIFGLSK
jgi:hypothetical protein